MKNAARPKEVKIFQMLQMKVLFCQFQMLNHLKVILFENRITKERETLLTVLDETMNDFERIHKAHMNLKVFVSLYYERFLISLSPFPVVFLEGRHLLLRRLKRPPGVHAWDHDPSESIARL